MGVQGRSRLRNVVHRHGIGIVAAREVTDILFSIKEIEFIVAKKIIIFFFVLQVMGLGHNLRTLKLA